ncbi:hypothetical protein AVEN_134859-1 [Araneus ventricosus]|uniref:Uncharacterized protein n=1 Tax=Araneus ventricosus TaxID=182803 RepID=A0A4Y2K2M8_ARAVE|nr:hypothetical protein AVEN_134859-1 [Araneus ventricosus]
MPITSCPQLVFLPLTGSERMLSSSLNMALSLPTSQGFTCLTAINAVVQNWHNTSLCHGVRPHNVFRRPAPNFKQEWLKRVANNQAKSS